ncbi:IclR family transcriptional regulator [Ketogulonicigenium vulgare]|uniref:IclR family transcriptional regulator n=1 Tax=Ketogulonicigenium vulgare TaxID=92945 RepID=UPI00235816B4|nr:IclR family transcriptional regulator [Ketogulonicigenium vulgare]
MSYTISAVDRALQLLEALADSPESGISELAERTGFTKSLIFRLLYTLEERGFVSKDPVRRTYSLSWQAVLLGAKARRQSRLISAATPHMVALQNATECNVLVQVRDDLHSVTVAMLHTRASHSVFGDVGRQGPLHAGAGPKILLAYAPEAIRTRVLASALPRYTENTVIDPERLNESLDIIRRDGWVITEGELDHSTCSVAVPLFNGAGEAIATMAVNGPVALLPPEKRGAVLDALRDAARQIAGLIGNYGSPPERDEI